MWCTYQTQCHNAHHSVQLIVSVSLMACLHNMDIEIATVDIVIPAMCCFKMFIQLCPLCKLLQVNVTFKCFLCFCRLNENKKKMNFDTTAVECNTLPQGVTRPIMTQQVGRAQHGPTYNGPIYLYRLSILSACV